MNIFIYATPLIYKSVIPQIPMHLQLQELKQRASDNSDEPFLNPGISEKQPLHVVVVWPFEIVTEFIILYGSILFSLQLYNICFLFIG